MMLWGSLFSFQGKTDRDSPMALVSDGHNKSTRSIHVLQNMADATLNEGYGYFAIARPHDISNFDNMSMMNTAEEFIAKCSSSSASILVLGNNAKCGFVSNNVVATAAIFAFREQPKTMMVYDAQGVREYLVANGHYRSDSYEKVDEFLHKRLLLQDIPDVKKLITQYQSH